MSSVIPFILQTYDEWKGAGIESSFTSNEVSWTFSSNVIGDNIIINSDDGSNKRRFIIQNKSILLHFLKQHFCNIEIG
jgi:hypothetical protein